MHPRVLARAKSHKLANQAAWALTLQDLEKSTKQVQANNPTDVLMVVLLAWCAIGTTTSGLESAFGVSRLLFIANQHSSAPDTEDWLHHIILAESDIVVDTIIRTARVAYSNLFNPPRVRHVERIDKGIKRKKRLSQAMM